MNRREMIQSLAIAGVALPTQSQAEVVHVRQETKPKNLRQLGTIMYTDRTDYVPLYNEEENTTVAVPMIEYPDEYTIVHGQLKCILCLNKDAPGHFQLITVRNRKNPRLCGIMVDKRFGWEIKE